MNTNKTINQIISSCPAPVSSSSTVSDALYWVDLVNVWSRVTTQELPNKEHIINMCNLGAPEIIILSTDYDTINNILMHIKSALNAVVNVEATSTPVDNTDVDTSS